MSEIDFNKPIRMITHRHLNVRYVGHRNHPSQRIIVVANNPEIDAYETVYTLSETELENIPESRWMNIYNDCSGGIWHRSRQAANAAIERGAQLGLVHTEGEEIFDPETHESLGRLKLIRGRAARIAVIEDRQDGSPFIVHMVQQ